MNQVISYSVIVFFVSCSFLICNAQTTRQQKNNRPDSPITFQISTKSASPTSLIRTPTWAANGIGGLSVNVLAEIVKVLGASSNVIISPLSVWTVLLMLLEASAGKTAEELKNVLGLSNSLDEVRFGYINLRKALTKKTDAVEISWVNLLVNGDEDPPDEDYQKIIKDIYSAEHFVIDDKNKEESVNRINEWVYKSTKNRINGIISASDVNTTQVLLANAAYFKGRWKYPFNATNTTLDMFKNEDDVIIGEIPMMNQKVVLPYGYSPVLQSQIVELPYADNKTSMIVILPRRKTKVLSVLNLMKNMTLNQTLTQGMGPEGLTDDEIDLYVPRFNVESNMILNVVLQNMGLVDMFSPADANFTKLSENVYVSRVIHKAEIENSEEGTTASSVTGTFLSYKTTSVKFHANRPFIYIINDISSRTVIFAGIISKP